ncbi:signal peptide protein [Streptomyces sediminimaris]|uniref:signal peptide protein n=1 Tax=Streptomyces sediminimaris TaxID=3383721 RepID=UPI00399995E9
MALAVAASGLTTAGPAMAVTRRAAPGPTASPRPRPPAAPSHYLDEPAGPLRADGERHEFTVTYRDDTAGDQTVAPQLLVVSPDGGPYLTPSDVMLERRTADGCWEPVRVGTRTGTLYTGLPGARRTLHPGERLTEIYRLTVLEPQAEGTVRPRVAFYD